MVPRAETFLAIANELVASGLSYRTDDIRHGDLIEASVRQFRREPTATMAVVARCLDDRDGLAVWDVTFAAKHDDGSPISSVVLTLALQAAQNDIAPPPVDRALPTPAKLPDSADRAESSAASMKRARIEEAAAEVIARKGFAAASIREIADAAGMHVPTLYQYIGSKDELLELVYWRTMTALKADLDAELTVSATAEQKLRTAIRILVGRGDRFRHRIGLLNRELRSLSPTARTRVLGQYRDLMSATAEIIRAGMQAGEFRIVDPAIVANLVDGACDMWALRRFALGHVDMETFGEEIAEMLVRGLRV